MPVGLEKIQRQLTEVARQVTSDRKKRLLLPLQQAADHLLAGNRMAAKADYERYQKLRREMFKNITPPPLSRPFMAKSLRELAQLIWN
jgi:hypothetical protein